MQTITSKDNPRLKTVRALLRSKKDRQEASAFVMEGVRALSALADGSALPQYRLKEVWVSSDAPELAGIFTVPVFAVAHSMMEQLSDCRSSQGILGVVEYRPVPLEIEQEGGNYLLVDSLTDPGNLGTLIRSAAAFGFNGVFLHGDTVEVFNPKTVRAAMGALPFIDCRETDETVLKAMKQAGYNLISTVICGGENLHQMKFGLKNVLIIGNEARGVSEAVQRYAARKLSIPMSGKAESLNAAVAGSICMFSMSAGLNFPRHSV